MEEKQSKDFEFDFEIYSAFGTQIRGDGALNMLWIFLAAALVSGIGVWLADTRRGRGAARFEGVAFVAAVILAAFVALAAQEAAPTRVLNLNFGSLESLQTRSGLSSQFLLGAKILLLTGAIYVLSALRGLAQLPTGIADLLVVGAAFLVTRDSEVWIRVERAAQGDAAPFNLKGMAPLLTILWIWMVARLCSTLNRAPAVSPGYLTILSGTLFLLMGVAGQTDDPLPQIASVAVCGAGAITFFLSLKRTEINIGWSATLAMGFLLGTVFSLGLLKNTLPALLCMTVLALGVPLLNLFIVKGRAQWRGKKVTWENRHFRLDEALAARGVAPRKVALFFFSLGLWLCSVCYFATWWFFALSPGLLMGSIFALIVAAILAGGSVIFFSVARVQMRRRPDEKVPQRLEAFGVELSPVSMAEALQTMDSFIREGTPHHVVTSDANAILTSRHDPEYAAIMRRAALITPDGFGVIWGARLLNLPVYERVTGVDMVTGLCELAARNGYGIYILGSKPAENGEPSIADAAAANLSKRYPGLRVVGTHHGFWRRDGKAAGLSTEEADAQIAAQIRAAKPDILFVAMGIPMQEKFIAAQLQAMNVPVSLGVGGSFDVYSGKFNRAPVIVQRIGMEWLYRVWIEPSRWRRMGYVPKFMLVALKTWIFGDKRALKNS